MEQAVDRPRVLLCGPHRAGKTSILNVVFQKMSPHETLFLETTPRMEVTAISRSAFFVFDVMDTPGGASFEEVVADASFFATTSVVVYVLDAQEEPYADAVAQARKAIQAVHRINRRISFDVLIHKVDGDQFFDEDHKRETVRDLSSKITESLLDKMDVRVTFHCTSIYDHTIFEAFSKIVQKMTPLLPVLEQCLDLLITNSRMEKAYLFDVISKVYIASDPHPVDLQSFELCSDLIDAVVDVSCIYSAPGNDGCQALGAVSDLETNSVMHLNNGSLLYFREIDRYLALVCVLREDNFDRQHLLDHNIHVFKEALADIFTVSRSLASSS